MNDFTKFIIQNTVDGKIEKSVGVEMIKMFLENKDNEPPKDIAIIGMALKMPKANDMESFWQNIENGVECIRDIPQNRKKDMEEMLGIDLDFKNDNKEFIKAGYLEDIDKFDYKFFKISPLEAKLMNPSHRIFMQTAYKAIEDAGYSSEKLAGTNTGVFVGHNDSNIYGSYIMRTEPQLTSMSIPGNMAATLSGRLSYLFDFKGPNLLVDTACSSSLVAIYLACKSIRSGDCEQAIAGGIKINLFPVEGAYEMGVESKNNKVRAFDENSDGTSWGEGAAVIMLKPLEKALADKDNIYAVIKGVASNQDGTSISMTAPNSLAQKEVIISAWKDAGIDPETISYIEAHGTGTKLGDPVEITGIQKAFMEYTDKKQFCAIGSIKPNIGHIDNASGVTSLIKAVLALMNKVIPPTINFEKPNRAIAFEKSPVYIADRKVKWEANGFPRRCGVSSYGFSGTNCHIVLEEAPNIVESTMEASMPEILVLSAKSKEALLNLIKSYKEFMNRTQLKLRDICYTAATGRSHFEYRLAIKANCLEDAKKKIESIHEASLEVEGYLDNGIYYGIINSREMHSTNTDDDSNNSEIQRIDVNTEELDKISQKYILGKNIDWEKFYMNTQAKKVSIPTYQFEERRCWFDWGKLEKNHEKVNTKTLKHPLLDSLLADSFNQKIYITRFDSKKYWVLKEHSIMGNSVVPETTYLEMIKEICSLNDMGQAVTLKDVYFFDPLMVDESEYKDVQVIAQQDEDRIKFTIVSMSEGKWIKHVEATAQPCEKINNTMDIGVIKKKCSEKGIIDEERYSTASAAFGPRWRSLKEVFVGKGEFLSRFELPSQFISDIEEYGLHPALMDCAVNTINTIIGMLGDGVYLPLEYKILNIYNTMPDKFYSYIRRTNQGGENTDRASYDITLLCEDGTVFVDIKGYMVEKMVAANNRFRQLAGEVGLYYETKWIPITEKKPASLELTERILLFDKENGISGQLAELLRDRGAETIEVSIGECYQKVSDSKYIIGTEGKDYVRLLADVLNTDLRLTRIIHYSNIEKFNNVKGLQELTNFKKYGVLSLFHLTKAIYECQIKDNIQMVLVADCATEVTGQEGYINPYNNAFLNMGKVIDNEFSNLRLRCVDIEETTGAETIYSEILSPENINMIAYRNGQRYIQYLKELSIEEKPSQQISVKSEGVYIITGGFGWLGLEMGKYLSQKGKANICLIGRKQLPPMEEWDTIINKNDDSKMCRKLETIKQMKASGANVIYCSGDVSNFEQMNMIIGKLRDQFGSINGIVHAAGVAGDGILINKSEETFCNVINPKVDGTWILDILTQNDTMDFFVLFSSVAVLAGDIGQADYTAANSFMDSYSFYRNKKGKRTLSINWTSWGEIGMAVDYGFHLNGVFKNLSTNDAIKAFDEVINKDINKVIIAEPNYNHSIFENEDNFPFKLSDEMSFAAKRAKKKSDKVKETKSWIANVKLKGKSDGSYTKTELKIGQIWCEILGIEEIDIHDDFIGLGGNSLIALKCETEMVKENLLINYSDISIYPTIAELSKLVDSKQKTNSNEENETQEIVENMHNTNFVSVQEEKVSNEVIKTDENYINKAQPCKTSSSRGSKELKIVIQNEISCYLHWSLPLCIVLADDRFLPWFYNKFTQVYCHTHKNDYVIFNYLENYNFICEIAQCQNLGLDLLKHIPSIIDFIIKNINNGFYMIINLDESLLPNKTAFGKEHFVHESLIYGYDDERRQIKAVGFNENNMFTSIEFEYDELVKAYESAQINYEETAMHCKWASIRLIKLKECNEEYPFSLKAFTNELKNYLFSIEDKGKTYICGGLEHEIISFDCGFKVYDIYINNLKKMLDGMFNIDYRAIHLLAEHKRCINNRLVFIMSKYDVPSGFKELCDEFADITEKFKQLRVKTYIQAQQALKSDILLDDNYKNTIKYIIDNLEAIKNEEHGILLQIYEKLGHIENDFYIK